VPRAGDGRRGGDFDLMPRTQHRGDEGVDDRARPDGVGYNIPT
jgi:hypothetical protein